MTEEQRAEYQAKALEAIKTLRGRFPHL